MYNPISTYRLQLHKEFNFEQVQALLSYFKELGVHTLYAAPIFKAVPGSIHGYDVTDPLQVNPEIGTEADLRSISTWLQHHHMGWMQDIVPNHMAFHSDNAWLMDALRQGANTDAAGIFDINCNNHSKMMVPFLAGNASEAIADGSLSVVYDQDQYYFKNGEQRYPLNQAAVKRLKDTGLTTEQINRDKPLLNELADQQYYELCCWKETDQRINYRRFFTINQLICLNMQSRQVFDRYHSYIKTLLDDGLVQALRIDHIDGLYDPTCYLQRLRKFAGKDTYIVAEKILGRQEPLPGQWPLQGTTGYDFLAIVHNLFTDAKHKKAFNDFYKKIYGKKIAPAKLLQHRKRQILYQYMGGELENLYQLLLTTLPPENGTWPQAMKDTIAAFLIACPVYRYYGNALPLATEEANAVRNIFSVIKADQPGLETYAAVLERIILDDPATKSEDYNSKALHFYQRCMQFTGPLMAKGMEDTLMYRYNRFIGHNDVGDTPFAFGLSVAHFHEQMQLRQQHWPLTMNATATHDTKRGEDVHARLNVLTELQEAWIAQVQEWQLQNAPLKTNGMPDANDEYFIYQTLAGCYPMPGITDEHFEQRMLDYIEKVLREAKKHTDWANPDEQYEQAAKAFISKLLDPSGTFPESLQTFVHSIADYGIINALSQLTLKCSCPGVPDIYRGTELWDLTLVDPDNRQPIDYDLRQSMLAEIIAADQQTLVKDILTERYSGKIKLWLTHTLLQLRNKLPDTFAKGGYIPLQVQGAYKDHIVAFARRHRTSWVLVVTPLFLSSICKQQQADPLNIDWKNTSILLPGDAPERYLHQLSGNTHTSSKNNLAVQQIFQPLPLAVLTAEETYSDRAAGVLLHISSLPSAFGAGDLGPAARRFADFLQQGKQKIWQVLPLNPVVPDCGYSPYSSYATMAGNTLFISPEMLADAGLLTQQSVESCMAELLTQADFNTAAAVRTKLLQQAYDNFKNAAKPDWLEAFDSFKHQQDHWLHDFALYVLLKQAQEDKPWYEWSPDYKDRDPEALQAFERQHTDAMNYVKWQQFIFQQQWEALRAYCDNLGIRMFGDLPFYVSRDAADVWANRAFFSLDADGEVAGMAGVPPDYFSETGQLWGMPTYRWDALQEQGYAWWVQRLRRNLELFDLVRIDHFRALAAYWEVPAGETTAINGKWIPGPGKAFFDILEKELGKLPFVAEDLGDNMQDVYVLRDAVNLPGMKVLQFAFGDHLPQSVDIPHNYPLNCIVYTGTHDNNTTSGWYVHEANKADRKRLEKYLHHKVHPDDVHLELARMAYASVAKIAMLPMQDITGLPEAARMNTPGTASNNWLWRMMPEQMDEETAKRLRNYVLLYNRW